MSPEAPIPVVLTVDVEPDNAWENHLNPSVANVKELLRLQVLLDRYGAKATCLVTYRVTQDSEAVEVLRELVRSGAAEIGAHLHPWETPPFMPSGLDVRYHTYPHELPMNPFEQKMGRLTRAITSRFGRSPTSYRAGRWGLVAAHLPVLERLGYVVDTSVTPLVDWRSDLGVPREKNGCGGPDYRRAPQRPYYPSRTDLSREGDARILEVPVTVAFTRRAPRFIRCRWGTFPHIVRRALRWSGVLRPVWAVPSEQASRDLARMTEVELRSSADLFNITLHSSELMPGGSPRSRTREEVHEIYNKIALILAILTSHADCVFTTLTDAARQWTSRELRSH